MSYADYIFYSTVWGGESSEEEIEKYLSRASDDIDMITDNQIELNELTAKQIEYLKKANCVQADTYISHGYNEDVYDSVSVGKVSLSGLKKLSIMNNKAMQYLISAGLLVRSVKLCTDLHQSFY